MRHFFWLVFLFVSFFLHGQNQKLNTLRVKYSYDSAYLELKDMLEGRKLLSFKRAVFITENAYYNNQISYKTFNGAIAYLARHCQAIASQNLLIYNDKDLDVIKKNAAVFKFMTDTVKYYSDSVTFRKSQPYSYDFNDFWGERDWSKMFVTKLLQTNTGNCHSLPFLYKILCEELGASAYLALAPNHIYIKQYAQSCGWYNTELTSGQFPMDAWIMASGYIHLNAIQNGLYMDTLSQKQSIAICVTDLAKGYEKKFPRDYEFILKCANLSLQCYPMYTNALLLKAETLKKQFEEMTRISGAQYPSQMFKKPEAKELYDSMEKLYFHIHQLGYRTMPKEMYMNWLADLKKHKEKYENKEIITRFKSIDRK